MPAKIKHKIIEGIEYKRCSECKQWLSLNCFSSSKDRSDGLDHRCKKCHKQYRIDNKKYLKQQKNQYIKNNKNRISKQRKQHYKNNTKRILQRNKAYYKKNSKKYKKRVKLYKQSTAFYNKFAQQLDWIEKIDKGQNGELVVLCAYCGKKHQTTIGNVNNRITAINKSNIGNRNRECRFYCSDNCKQSCPIYNQKKWPKGFKKATSREVVPLLRQIVLERDGYACLRCGATTETAQLHVHHITPYAQNKMQANDPDSCITLCKEFTRRL